MKRKKKNFLKAVFYNLIHLYVIFIGLNEYYARHLKRRKGGGGVWSENPAQMCSQSLEANANTYASNNTRDEKSTKENIFHCRQVPYMEWTTLRRI